MKFAWLNNMKDYAAMNQDCKEEVDLSIYEDLLSQDHREANLDIELAGGEPADESNIIIEIWLSSGLLTYLGFRMLLFTM